MKNKKIYILLIITLSVILIIAYKITTTTCPVGNHLTGFRYISQKSDSNCGGACLEMVIRFIKSDYTTMKYNQCTIDSNFIVSEGIIRTASCISPCSECKNNSNCFYPHDRMSIPAALNLYLIRNTILPISTPRIDTKIKTQIDSNKKPIIAYGSLNIGRIDTDHFIVICGYSYVKVNGNCKFLVEIYDPYGCDTCTYKVPLSGGIFKFERLIFTN
jgi:hypothetical protein